MLSLLFEDIALASGAMSMHLSWHLFASAGTAGASLQIKCVNVQMCKQSQSGRCMHKGLWQYACLLVQVFSRERSRRPSRRGHLQVHSSSLRCTCDVPAMCYMSMYPFIFATKVLRTGARV